MAGSLGVETDIDRDAAGEQNPAQSRGPQKIKTARNEELAGSCRRGHNVSQEAADQKLLACRATAGSEGQAGNCRRANSGSERKCWRKNVGTEMLAEDCKHRNAGRKQYAGSKRQREGQQNTRRRRDAAGKQLLAQRHSQQNTTRGEKPAGSDSYDQNPLARPLQETSWP